VGCCEYGNEIWGFIRRGIYRPVAPILTLQEGSEVTYLRNKNFQEGAFSGILSTVAQFGAYEDAGCVHV